MKYLKLFDSISSDRRAFKNWLTQIGENDEFDEELFSIFVKNRPKLDDKNIFNYKSKKDLIQALKLARLNIPVKKFQKDLRNWDKIGLNCDVLYQDDNYVILHSKDFESEKKLGSGCHICTNHQPMYDGYMKSGAYLFDILDLKNNERYFGTYTNKPSGFQRGKRYNIVDKKDNMFIVKDWDGEKWIEDNPPYGKRPGLPENHDFIKICEDILEEKFLK